MNNSSEINYIDVNISKIYKYIRYTPPNLNKTNISNIKLFGQLKSEINRNLNEDFQPTNLPLISIYTENYTNLITKDQDINYKFIIINNAKIETKEDSKIKVRGKSTSFAAKRPYRIKFIAEQKILGIKGSYKKLVLLTNLYDFTLMRNALAFKISELMGFEYTRSCKFVDLILNGDIEEIIIYVIIWILEKKE